MTTNQIKTTYWQLALLVIFQFILSLVVVWRVKMLDNQLQELTSPKYELERYFDEGNKLDTKLELIPLN